MRKAAIILFILVSFVAVAAQPGSTPASVPSVALPPELDRVLRDYESAWAAKDAARLAKLFAEDGYVLPGGSPPVKGRAAIETYYTGHGGPLFLRAIAYAAEGKVGYILGGYTGAAGSPDEGNSR